MILIKNGTVIDCAKGQSGKKDILIKGNRIVKIGENLLDSLQEKPDKIIHADGLFVAPGLVDVHVHFRDPGFTYKEDIFSGARAAAAGGFTSVVLMANTKPVVDNEETLSYVLGKGQETGIHIYSCASVTRGMQGTEMTDMSLLYKKGAIGFSDDGVPVLEEALVKRAMEEAAKLKAPLSFHEENPRYIKNNGIHAGEAAKSLGIEGADRQAEVDLIERDLKLALETGATVNIQHISTKEGVELLRKAKEKGGDVHGEATPHHFTLTQDAVLKYGTNAKMNPPLREEADRQAIIKGLQDGTIDLIATDHAPHSQEEKEREFTKAPSGIIGLETALPLGITTLVEGHYLKIEELIQKMSYNPARLYKLPAGELKEGGAADLVIFTEKEKQTFQKFHSKASNSPFMGEELHGAVIYTICDGEVVFDHRKK